MVDRSVRAVLSLESGPFVAGLARARAAADQFSKGLDDIDGKKESLNRVGSAATIAGASLLALGGIAVGVSANFDEAMSHVEATGADAAKSIDALREAALAAGATTAFSATEAAAGLEELAKAGVSAEDSLAGGLTGALDLAAAGGLGVADAANIAATAMTQFGLSGADVPHIADLLAAAAGKAQGSVHDMGEALKYVGPVAHQMGISIEETSGTIASLAAQGILGSQAGTSLRGMLASLTSPSKVAANTMKDLGISVYDASGEFVGFRGIAGQLQSQMQKLTNAERDEALGRIFGNEQITAARILYAGGAAAVDEWTNSVNDSGFAAETAATRMDNLKGDFEELRGAAETAFINLGSGADAPLRSLVQGVTGAINAFNDLEESTQGTVLAVIGTVGAFALASGGLVKLATSAAAAKTALAALNVTSKQALIGIPLIGAAIAGVSAILSHFMGEAARSAAATSDFESALVGVTEQVTAQNAALNTNVRAAAAKQLQDQGAFDAAKSLGLSLQTVTEATLGNASAQAEVNAALAKYAQTGSGVNAMNAGYVQSSTEAGTATRAQADAADLLRQAIGGGNTALNEAIQNSQDLAAAAAESSTAAETSSNLYDTAGAALATMASEANSAETEVEDLTESLFATGDAILALSNSEIAFEAAIDAASEAVKKNGKELDVSTEAGRANMTALNRLGETSRSYIDSLITQGASTERVVKATKNARAAFVESAVAAGMGSKQAKALADSLGLVPEDTQAAVSAPGAVNSKAQTDAFNEAIKDLPPDVKTIVKSEFDRAGINAANAALEAIRNKQVTTYITTVRRESRPIAPGGAPQRTMATGGPVWGPGTGTSDSIPAWLSNGEFVQPASAVDYYGHAFMEAIRRMQIPKDAFGFAAGGLVRGYANGGSIDEGPLWRLIKAMFSPIANLARLEAASGRGARVGAREDLEDAKDDLRAARRTKNKKAIERAEDELDKAQDKYRDTADRSREAVDRLKEAQQQFADQARQIADQMMGNYDTRSTDPYDILNRKREGATELGTFDKNLDRLRKMGLDPTIISDIIKRGATDGNEVASQIIDQGSKLVKALNDAQKKLTKAAQNVGWDQAVLRRAGGGLIDWGPTGEDKVRLLATRGEYVHQPEAVDYYTVGVMDQINQRKIPREVFTPQPITRQRTYVPERTWAQDNLAGGNAARGQRKLEVNFNGPVGAQANEVVSILNARATTAFAMDGLEYAGG